MWGWGVNVGLGLQMRDLVVKIQRWWKRSFDLHMRRYARLRLVWTRMFTFVYVRACVLACVCVCVCVCVRACVHAFVYADKHR